MSAIAAPAQHSNITYGDLFGDALGAIPGAGEAEEADEFQWIIPQEEIPDFNALIDSSRWINYYQ